MIENCLNLLKEIENSGVRVKPDTAKLLSNLNALVGYYEKLSLEDREFIKGSFTPRVGMKLVVIGSFAAERAMSTRDKNLLKTALMAHVLEDVQTDYRENIRNLVLIDHAATMIGTDIKPIKTEVERFASEGVKKLLGDFILKQSGKVNLEDFDVAVKNVGGELRFVPVSK